MKQKKPYILPLNEPTCYVNPEVMKQFDDELDEEYWSDLCRLLNKGWKTKKEGS